MDYQQLFNASRNVRTTTPRPRGQRNWWDNMKEAFAAPADGSAPGMAVGSGSTVPTTPRPFIGPTTPTPRPVGSPVDLFSAVNDGSAPTPRPVGSPVDLFSAVNDGSAPTRPPMGQTQSQGYSSYDAATGAAGSTINTTTLAPGGTTTLAPGGTTTLAPGGTTTPVPDEIDGVNLEQAGQDAYQRNLANILGGIDTRKQAAGEGFSDLYQQFQDQKTMQDSMTDPRGLTGGMERQEGARQSAAEIGAMTDLASQRQRAVDQIEAEKMTAELEAGRMTAEQYELDKQTNPAWQQGELLAQKYNETGDIDDFNEYLTHMSGLLGIEPSLANSTDIDKAMPEIRANVKTQIQQYIQNPDMLQQITGFGGNAVATITGLFGAGKGLAALGTWGSAFAFSGAGGITAATTGVAGAATAGAKAVTLGGAAGPVGIAVVAGVLAVIGIIGLVRNIRASKSKEEATVQIDKLLAKERERIIGGGFSEEEADDAIAGLRKTLPTAYQG